MITSCRWRLWVCGTAEGQNITRKECSWLSQGKFFKFFTRSCFLVVFGDMPVLLMGLYRGCILSTRIGNLLMLCPHNISRLPAVPTIPTECKFWSPQGVQNMSPQCWCVIFKIFFMCIAHSKRVLSNAIYIISIVVEEGKVLTMQVLNTSPHNWVMVRMYVCMYVCIYIYIYYTLFE